MRESIFFQPYIDEMNIKLFPSLLESFGDWALPEVLGPQIKSNFANKAGFFPFRVPTKKTS